MVYLGAPGIGKTYFCAALIPWIYDKVKSYRYWNEREFFSRLRAVIGESRGDFIQELEYLLDDELVMFDDMGSSVMNDWRCEMLFEAIDKRYRSELPTVFTSNLTRNQIYTDLGPRIHSRLFSKENLVIECHEGADLRQKDGNGNP